MPLKGDDFQNMAGIRGGDGAMQNFLRVNGTITADSPDLNSTPGLVSVGTYWYPHCQGRHHLHLLPQC